MRRVQECVGMYLQPFGKYGWELILRQGVRKCKVKHWVYLKIFNLNMLDIFQEHKSVHIFFKKSLLEGVGFTRENCLGILKNFLIF